MPTFKRLVSNEARRFFYALNPTDLNEKWIRTKAGFKCNKYIFTVK
jgi:hypothetical protein